MNTCAVDSHTDRHAEGQKTDRAQQLADCRNQLRQWPDRAALYCQLASLLLADGNGLAADRACAQALRIDPAHAPAWAQRSAIALANGQPAIAQDYQWQALELDPTLVSAQDHLHLGNTLANSGQFSLAQQCYEWAIQQQPTSLEAHLNLAWIAQRSGDITAEFTIYQQAINCGCSDPKLYRRLADCWARQGKIYYLDHHYLEAANAYQNAIQWNDQQSNYWSDLGCALVRSGQYLIAEAAHQQAIALNPQSANHYYNLGNFYWKTSDLDRAIAAFQNAIQIDPQDAKSHWNFSHVLLESGDLIQGFREYEWRWSTVQPPPMLQNPLWQGESLHHKTILLQAEQGLGDSLQFIRYANQLANQGARVWFSGPKPLSRLIAQMPEIDRVLLIPEPGQWIAGVDVRSPLLSLPHLLQTTLETIPKNVPYLKVNASDLEFGAESNLMAQNLRLNPQVLNVGIVWASGYRVEDGLHDIYLDKSAHFWDFLTAFDHPQVQLYSLQVGKNAGDLLDYFYQYNVDQSNADHSGVNQSNADQSNVYQSNPSQSDANQKSDRPISHSVNHSVIDCSPWIQDFADTAAICDRLDLIISVDTSVAHLAGGLGKPTWVLLPARSDWRWLRDRDDSPWYPTMRLFRQTTPGDWSEPLDRARQALLQVVQSHWQSHLQSH